MRRNYRKRSKVMRIIIKSRNISPKPKNLKVTTFGYVGDRS